ERSGGQACEGASERLLAESDVTAAPVIAGAIAAAGSGGELQVGGAGSCERGGHWRNRSALSAARRRAGERLDRPIVGTREIGGARSLLVGRLRLTQAHPAG